VVAIAPYACTKYYKAIPLVVSPLDKTEKWTSLAEWVSNFVKNYTDHSFDEKITRKIYALASDGDATFCRAKHKICMTTPLYPQSDLGNELSGLLGLNLFTSQDVMLGTCCNISITLNLAIPLLIRFYTNCIRSFLLLIIHYSQQPKVVRLFIYFVCHLTSYVYMYKRTAVAS
jgi:hypothetical protein